MFAFFGNCGLLCCWDSQAELLRVFTCLDAICTWFWASTNLLGSGFFLPSSRPIRRCSSSLVL